MTIHAPTLLATLLSVALISKAQNTQTIKGIVLDKASEKPLSGISVSVAGLSIGSTTDSNGVYILRAVPVGRQKISFSSVNYKSVIIPEVLVTAGKGGTGYISRRKYPQPECGGGHGAAHTEGQGRQ